MGLGKEKNGLKSTVEEGVRQPLMEEEPWRKRYWDSN